MKNSRYCHRAGTGIGRAVAQRFAKEGTKVLILGRTESTLKETAEANEDISYVVADIENNEDIEKVADTFKEKFGRLDILVNNAGWAPALLFPIECNPFVQQKAIRDILLGNNVKVECWGPLEQGNKELLTNAVIKNVGEKYGKDTEQIVLGVEVQEGMVVLPKSVNPARIKSNLDIFDFVLTEEEMNQIRELDTGRPVHDPDAADLYDWFIENYPIEG
jgi:hypothetical protein